MEALIPIFRLLHFVGFALLLGGTLSSIILVKKEGPTAASMRLAHVCTHMLAAPGLVLLILTGILHSSVLYWDNFKGAGYMHAKLLFVALIFLLMIFDIRTQKRASTSQDKEVVVDLIKKRQGLALSMAAITILVMWLVSFRPF